MDESKHEGFLDGALPSDEPGSGSTEQSDGFLDGAFEDKQPTTDWKEDADVEYQPSIFFHSSEHMDEVADESVELIVTSPPYNVGWGYGSHDDEIKYDEEYLPMLARVFMESWRVLRPGGRMCVNVPSLVRSGAKGGVPIASDITTMVTGNWKGDDYESGSGLYLTKYTDDSILQLQKDTDFVMREYVSWYKDFNADGLAPNGSFPRPVGVLLNNMHEVVLVFQKPGDRDYTDMPEEIIEESKINKTDDDMCDDVWFIHPDSWSPKYVDDEDIPVFPEKLVRRCIQLWTYKGDTVLDPFAGRFTVGKVAREEDRWSVGYELREELEQDIREYTHMQEMRFF